VHFTTLGFGQPESLADLPEDVSVGAGPKLKQMLRGKSDFLPALRRADLVIDIGEGDSWTDIYGTRRFALQVGSKAAALALGKPLVLAPQTIGPFDNPVKRRMSNWIMNRATAVFTRDSMSSDYVVAQHIGSETAEFIDVAFRLPFDRQARSAGAPRVGINVSGLLYQGGYTGKNELGLTIDYRAFTHDLIAGLIARGAEVHLVPHVVTKGGGQDDDLSVVPAIVQRFPAVRVPAPFPNASAAKSFISGLDFLVGGRMHACIGAFSAGVPVVPIAYSRKFNGLFGTLGYSHYIDGKKAGTSDALSRTLAAFDDRARIAEDLKPGLALAATRLDRYEDRLAAMISTLH
jgi:polysaccharide pyruvyl transferase WcaK-like protein